MKLYGFFRSSAAFRVRIALNLKGVAREDVFVPLRTGAQIAPDYRAINPQGLVPTLVTDDGTALTQSLAIIEYLDEIHPVPPLMPATPAARARVRALAQVVACEVHPLNNLRVLNYLTDELKVPREAMLGWYAHWVALGLETLEALLAGHPGSGRFCHGEAPGLADICLVPQIFNAQRFECPLDAYPTVMEIFDACMELDAFDRAQPAKQPDAEA